jgi:hypothetical protein
MRLKMITKLTLLLKNFLGELNYNVLEIAMLPQGIGKVGIRSYSDGIAIAADENLKILSFYGFYYEGGMCRWALSLA